MSSPTVLTGESIHARTVGVRCYECRWPSTLQEQSVFNSTRMLTRPLIFYDIYDHVPPETDYIA
jgi:hypothetical protein